MDTDKTSLVQKFTSNALPAAEEDCISYGAICQIWYDCCFSMTCNFVDQAKNGTCGCEDDEVHTEDPDWPCQTYYPPDYTWVIGPVAAGVTLVIVTIICIAARKRRKVAKASYLQSQTPLSEGGIFENAELPQDLSAPVANPTSPPIMAYPTAPPIMAEIDVVHEAPFESSGGVYDPPSYDSVISDSK